MKYLKLFEQFMIDTLGNPKNYNNYINYKVGDEVELVGEVDGRVLNRKIGRILEIENRKGFCQDVRSPYFNGLLYSWTGPTINVKISGASGWEKTWYITPYNVKKDDGRPKIKNPKEDPFEEEFWGFEED